MTREAPKKVTTASTNTMTSSVSKTARSDIGGERSFRAVEPREHASRDAIVLGEPSVGVADGVARRSWSVAEIRGRLGAHVDAIGPQREQGLARVERLATGERGEALHERRAETREPHRAREARRG